MNLSKISSFLSVGSALFAFFGLLKLYLFYLYFSVDILYFITFTDLLNASLEGLFIGFLFLPVLFITISFIDRRKIQSTNSLKTTFRKQPTFLIFGGILYAIITCSWLFYYIHFVFDNLIKCLILLAFISPFLAPYGIEKLFKLLNFQPLKLNDKVSISMILFVSLLYMSSAYKDVNFINQGYHKTTNVYLKDKTVLLGSDTTYYIGNTSQYLFFHDERNGEYVTITYPMSSIEKIEFD